MDFDNLLNHFLPRAKLSCWPHMSPLPSKTTTCPTQTTILAKIMWDKLAECTASTIDQFFTWKQTFFGPNSTSPPPPPPSPHAMLFVRKGLPKSRPTLHRGGRGERANIAAIREKGTLSHTFWPGLSISRTFTTNAHNSKCMECTVSKFVWVKFVHVLHTILTSRL